MFQDFALEKVHIVEIKTIGKSPILFEEKYGDFSLFHGTSAGWSDENGTKPDEVNLEDRKVYEVEEACIQLTRQGLFLEAKFRLG